MGKTKQDHAAEALIEHILTDVPENFPEGLAPDQVKKLLAYKRKRQLRREQDASFRKALVLPALIMLIALLSLVAPVAIDAYESWKAETVISQMEGVGSDWADDPERLYYKEQAERYNQQRQCGRNVMFEGDDDVLGYDMQLRWHDYPAIGWLHIPKINIKFPIYHHTNEQELINGVGHMDNSSLPVGGPGTHCGLSGHSGMTDKRMFDDVRKLEVGDVFIVWSLNEPHAYRVYDIEVVLPYETESMKMVPKRDLCTLVTCTPYGVNSHRLLVHGERCEYVPGEMDTTPMEAFLNSRTVPLYLGIAGCIIFVIAIVAVMRHRNKKKKAAREREITRLLDMIADTNGRQEPKQESIGNVEKIPPGA